MKGGLPPPVLTADSFRRLAELLLEIQKEVPLLPILAVYWLHPRHPIDAFQRRLVVEAAVRQGDPMVVNEGLVSGPSGGLHSAQNWGSIVRKSWSYARKVSAQSVRLRRLLKHELRKLRGMKFDLVAKTWCFGLARPSDGVDFYWGDLQARLSRRGVRMLLLCGDVCNAPFEAFARENTLHAGLPRIAELCLVPPLAPFRALMSQFSAALRLRAVALRWREPWKKRVGKLAEMECLSVQTTQALLMYWVGRTATQWWAPGSFLSLYEGQAWENVLWRGVKSAAPRSKIVGYQHTAVFQESIEISQPTSLGSRAVIPDVVLSTGPGYLSKLREGHQALGTKLISFGSFRYPHRPAVHPAPPERKCILVTPQGTTEDTETLFSFAYECALRMPSYRFIVRCHPNHPAPKALAKLKVDIRSAPNIVVSEEPVDSDFARSSVILYRASTTVLYAILQGLLPVFFRVDSLFNSDPADFLPLWRRPCASVDEFRACVEADECRPPEARFREWHAAAERVRSFVTPVQEHSLSRLLRSIAVKEAGPTA